MTMKDCNKTISAMKSIQDMHFWMVHLRNLAEIRGEYITRNAYDAAIYYMVTGRLSGECERAILANIKIVIRHLSTCKDSDYESMGNYLKGFVA